MIYKFKNNFYINCETNYTKTKIKHTATLYKENDLIFTKTIYFKDHIYGKFEYQKVMSSCVFLAKQQYRLTLTNRYIDKNNKTNLIKYEHSDTMLEELKQLQSDIINCKWEVCDDRGQQTVIY